MEHGHSLLRRQLKRYFGDGFSIPQEWQGFIDAVNHTYRDFDMDREMLERSLELSSQELLQANSEMRAIFQAIPDLLFRLDSEGTILDYKAGANTDLLLQPQKLSGKRIQDIPFKQIGNQFREAIRRVQEERSMVSIEYSLAWQGQEYSYEARLAPVLEDQIVVIVRNITERKQAEDQETRRRAWLEKVLELGKTVAQVTDWQACLLTIYESMQYGLEFDRVGLALYDLEHNVVRGVYGTNRAGERQDESWYVEPVAEHTLFREGTSSAKWFVYIPDYSAQFPTAPAEYDMQGVKEHVLVAAWAGDKPVAVLAVDNVITGRRMTEEQLEALRVFAGYAGLAIENARLYETVQQELAERKQAEAEREALITELEAKNAELERFIYTVSHDLKSPLITIRGFLGFVEKAALAGNIEQMQSDIARITNAVAKMKQLLDELLELSRIGRVMNPPEAIPLADLAREAVETVAGRLAERSVKVTIAPDLPLVYGDRSRMREVLENLVDNAVKYMGDQPYPRLEIGILTNGPESVFYVRDNGIGIEPRYHQRVFGLFDKLDQRTEGTGVGLAIVKRIVEVHGGRVWVESAGLGHGSTFYFTLSDWVAES